MSLPFFIYVSVIYEVQAYFKVKIVMDLSGWRNGSSKDKPENPFP
jgi:hypothetical protein